MWNKTVLMNFSGIYPQEDCFKEQGTWLDMTDLKGVNCYCTEEAGEIIRQRIRKFRGEGIHFLDSGNYHYLSKFWLEKYRSLLLCWSLIIIPICRRPPFSACFPAEAG